MQTVINKGSDNKMLMNQSLSYVGNLLGKINDKLIDSVKEEGILIVISDVLEYMSDSKDLEFLEKNIESKEIIDKFYEEYLNKYGFSLGSYGIYDAQTKMKEIDNNYLIWDFDENRKLLVKLLVLKK